MAWKKPIFALVAVLLFFALAESVLSLAGVDTLLAERDPFQGFSDQLHVFELDENKAIYRTVPRAVEHSFNYEQFAAEKPADDLRIFVIGGSSAQGFPWGGRYAFTRMLGEALRESRPAMTIEAVNAAAMSYGSHRLRILTDELAGYQPDLLIVYGGHNEFVERRFYETFSERLQALDAVRSLLYRSRLFSWMTRLYERMQAAPSPEAIDAATTGQLLGLDVRREYSVDVAAAEREEVQRHFEDNLVAVVRTARRAGARVILCTVPSNVRDWVPNQSSFDDGLDFEARRAVTRYNDQARAALEHGAAEEARELADRSIALSPGYAETHFLLGRALEQLGRYDDAREAYVAARDLDSQPSRASSALNEAIRRVAKDEGAILVDIEALFVERSPHGLVGFNLIEDYVHPNREGHRTIARELWRVLLEQGLVGEPRRADPAAFDRALAQAGLDDAGPTNDTNPAWLFNVAVVLEKQGLDEQAMEKYRACLVLDPGYHVARFNLGRLLFRHGRYAEAARQQQEVLRTQPDFVRAMIGLAEALKRIPGREAEAEPVARRAVAADPDSSEAWGSLGGVLSALGRQGEAEAAFRRAVDLAPRDAGSRTDLGFTLLFQGRVAEARSTFREALQEKPEDLRARNGLAATLVDSGELDEAERMFRENLRTNPADDFARGGLEKVRKLRAGSQAGE